MEPAAARYGRIDYWDAAVPGNTEQPVEWYFDFASLKPLLAQRVSFGDTILVVGPGLSAVHEQLFDSGYRGLTVVDAAPEVLAAWRARSEAQGRSIKFERADVAAGLECPRLGYNAVIDKGTIDCLLCRDAPHGERDAAAAVAVLHGALRAPGTLLLVSHAPPPARLPLLETRPWQSIQVKVVYPPALADVAAGGPAPAAAAQDYDPSAPQLDVGASYVYICRKPY